MKSVYVEVNGKQAISIWFIDDW